MPELEAYLLGYFLINKDELAQASSLFHVEHLNRNDFFVKSGHYADKLSFVKSGIVRVYASHGDKEVTQWISTPGYFLTDLRSLIFDETAKWNMQAITDCELFTISKTDYRQLGVHVNNWAELEKRFLSNCFITLEERVFSFLSATAQERYEQLFQQNPGIFNQVPLQYIASMLGMTPETLSRIRGKK